MQLTQKHEQHEEKNSETTETVKIYFLQLVKS